MTPHICSIPREILELIALEIVLLEGSGRPADLVSLFSTCSDLYNKLSFNSCPALYARLYKGMFDTGAALRRLGPKAVRSSNLASQFRVNCSMLRRIRQGDVYSPYLLQDFWLAFLLITENDGKNRVQLEEAGLGPVVNAFVRTRLWEDAENGWPRESIINALALWLLWCMTSQGASDPTLCLVFYAQLLFSESVEREHPNERTELVRLVLPYVVMAFKVRLLSFSPFYRLS